MDAYANFAWSLVVVAPSPPSSGTTLTVRPGDGVIYPPVPFNAVVAPVGTLPLATNAEILRVTARTGDILTFSRAQEGSSIRAITAGDQIYQGITEKMIDDLFAAMTPGPQGPIGPQGPAGPQGPIGPAGPATSVGDATYWTVTAHAGLTDERVMSSLANGYVKSTAGEPSTVAVIPVADGGTGAANATTARTNLGLGSMAVQQASAVAITGGSLTAITTFEMVGVLRVTGSAVFSADVYGFRFIGDGYYATNLNAANLTGYVPRSSLGSGAFSATTYLAGDQTWKQISDIFPSGLIVLSLYPCPPGFTRVTTIDTRFIRVGPTPGVSGGAGTHVHGPGSYASQDHQHGPGNYHATNHAHNGTVNINISGTTGPAGAHAHGYGGTINGTTLNDNAGINTADAGASFNVPRTPHQHDFAVNYSGTTDPVSDHAHPFSGSGSGPIGAEEPAVWGNSGVAGAAAIVGAAAAADHLPPFFDFFLCQKN